MSGTTAFTWPFISCDLREASAATGLSVSEIQQAVRDGELSPSYRGRKPIFRADELYAWVASMPSTPPLRHRA